MPPAHLSPSVFGYKKIFRYMHATYHRAQMNEQLSARGSPRARGVMKARRCEPHAIGAGAGAGAQSLGQEAPGSLGAVSGHTVHALTSTAIHTSWGQ
jgi:hypothetical protein